MFRTVRSIRPELIDYVKLKDLFHDYYRLKGKQRVISVSQIQASIIKVTGCLEYSIFWHKEMSEREKKIAKASMEIHHKVVAISRDLNILGKSYYPVNSAWWNYIMPTVIINKRREWACGGLANRKEECIEPDANYSTPVRWRIDYKVVVIP